MNAPAQSLITKAKAALHIGNTNNAHDALDALNHYAIFIDNMLSELDAVHARCDNRAREVSTNFPLPLAKLKPEEPTQDE